jgi:type VI secretion system secreted protein VgrG
VPDVVAAVLGEAGVAARFELARAHPVREYCTQYEETDFDFLSRLLAEEGIFFYFEQPEPTALAAALAGDPELVVVADEPTAYGAVRGLGPAPVARQRYVTAEGLAGTSWDKLLRFVPEANVRPTVVEFREYDPTRPLAKLVVRSGDEASATPGVAGAPELEIYDHGSRYRLPSWELAGDEATTILRRHRRHARQARGESRCSSLAPGCRFALEREAAGLDEYVVTSVRHEGSVATGTPPYRNHFGCVPAEVPFPPLPPKRRGVLNALTATVVGPEAEEIHVDERGQIKVQFHWDRDGKNDDKSSCWIRTLQAWGGAGWGTQFIPRVGMEVTVLFEGGRSA